MEQWFVAVKGRSQGPFSRAEVTAGLAAGRFTRETMVWRDGFSEWLPIGQVPELSAQPVAPTPPPTVPDRRTHEIDYEIFGNEMQFIEIELEPGESAVSEAGAMMYMSDYIEMETIFGDGSDASQSGGLFDRMLGAGKRLISGDGFIYNPFSPLPAREKVRSPLVPHTPGKSFPWT